MKKYISNIEETFGKCIISKVPKALVEGADVLTYSAEMIGCDIQSPAYSPHLAYLQAQIEAAKQAIEQQKSKDAMELADKTENHAEDASENVAQTQTNLEKKPVETDNKSVETDENGSDENPNDADESADDEDESSIENGNDADMVDDACDDDKGSVNKKQAQRDSVVTSFTQYRDPNKNQRSQKKSNEHMNEEFNKDYTIQAQREIFHLLQMALDKHKHSNEVALKEIDDLKNENETLKAKVQIQEKLIEELQRQRRVRNT